LVDLFERLRPVLGVSLVAEGADVADQKIDLFVKAVPAAEILTAITDLFNSEGPKGYRWERSGNGPEFRYVLVRDLASRQWAAQRAEEGEGHLASLLRDRLRALRNEPFRAQPERPFELPAMRKLLCALTDAQVTQLAAERFLRLSQFFDPEPSPLWKELSGQAVEREIRRDPETVPEKIAWATPSDLVPRPRVEIRLLGDPAQYRVHVGVGTPAGGAMSEVCRFADPAAVAQKSTGVPSVDRWPVSLGAEPAFALPPRTS